MKIYTYEGPVCIFDKCVMHQWNSSTVAVSESKAKSNLAYQFKKAYGYGIQTKVTLPGILIEKQKKEYA